MSHFEAFVLALIQGLTEFLPISSSAHLILPSEVFGWDEIPAAHEKMRLNEHKPGNMAVLVQAPRTGLRTFEDTLEASERN